MVRVTKALALVGAISMALSLPVAAADRPVVLQVIGVKVTGDMDAYLEKIKKAQSISKRLGTPTPRVWRSTLAGPDTGTVFVAIEHKNMATPPQAPTKMSKDPPGQSILQEMGKSGI